MCMLRIHTSNQLHPRILHCKIPHGGTLVATVYKEAGTNMIHKDDTRLTTLMHASKREIEARPNNTYLVFRPDKEGFNQRYMKKHIMVDQLTYDECKAKVVDFLQV